MRYFQKNFVDFAKSNFVSAGIKYLPVHSIVATIKWNYFIPGTFYSFIHLIFNTVQFFITNLVFILFQSLPQNS